MEEVIDIETRGGNLFGILHSPDPGRPRRSSGIVLVNSRVEYRLGPHRFSVEAARRWADDGSTVLRFDYPGNGDSVGNVAYAGMDSFPVDPCIDVIEDLTRRAGVDDVTVVGNCMGARNALFASADCPAVRRLVLFGMPFSNATPYIQADGEMETQAMSSNVARRTLRGYLGRISDPGAWKRLFSGKSEVDVMLRALGAGLGLGQGRVFQEPVFRSLDRFLSRNGRMLFVFGANDIFLPDFQHELARVKSRLPHFDELTQIRFVENANHTFSRVAWKAEALEHASKWLNDALPPAETSA